MFYEKTFSEWSPFSKTRRSCFQCFLQLSLETENNENTVACPWLKWKATEPLSPSAPSPGSLSSPQLLPSMPCMHLPGPQCHHQQHRHWNDLPSAAMLHMVRGLPGAHKHPSHVHSEDRIEDLYSGVCDAGVRFLADAYRADQDVNRRVKSSFKLVDESGYGVSGVLVGDWSIIVADHKRNIIVASNSAFWNCFRSGSC